MNKKHGILKILAAAFCIFLVIIFALSASGNTPAFMNKVYGFLHIRLSDENSGDAGQTAPIDEEDYPTAFPVAENTLFAKYKGDIICANATLYALYTEDANLSWSAGIQMQEPILAVKGDYVLISETGAKKISLFKGKKLVYTVETEGNIYTADLSSKGDVIAVTEKEYYKGQVVVFNKSGKKVFVWDSGSYSILDAAISNSRKVGISLLSTDEGASSIIQIFDVNGNELCKTGAFKNTVFFNTDFDGDNLALLSESQYVCMNTKGEIKWKYDFGGRKIMKRSRDSDGNCAILFDNEGIGEIVAITSKGEAYPPIKTKIMPDAIDINSKSVAYNNGRTAIMTSYDGKKVLTTECSNDIRRIYITGQDRVFCVYSTAVQEKKLSK